MPTQVRSVCHQTGNGASFRSAATAGFTLLELLVTVAILAILATLATPSFTSLINSNRLTAQANEVVASLQLARTEAIKQNRRTIICRSTNGTSCAGAGQWTQWITYVDINSSGTPQAAEIVRINRVKAPLRVTSEVASITFRADGMARTAAGALQNNAVTVCIPTTRPVENRRIIDLRAGSRISSKPENGAGACP